MNTLIKSMIWVTVQGVAWFLRGLRKKVEGNIIITDDTSFPRQTDHSKDKIEEHTATKFEKTIQPKMMKEYLN